MVPMATNNRVGVPGNVATIMNNTPYMILSTFLAIGNGTSPDANGLVDNETSTPDLVS